MPNAQNRQKEKVHKWTEKSFAFGHFILFGGNPDPVSKEGHECDKEDENDLAGKVEVQGIQAIQDKPEGEEIGN